MFGSTKLPRTFLTSRIAAPKHTASALTGVVLSLALSLTGALGAAAEPVPDAPSVDEGAGQIVGLPTLDDVLAPAATGDSAVPVLQLPTVEETPTDAPNVADPAAVEFAVQPTDDSAMFALANIPGTSVKPAEIAAGASHSLALGADGEVWAWGSNSVGALGDNTTTTRSTPAKVHGVGDDGFLTGITQIAAADNCSFALAANGDLYAWGDNQYGQLGVGDYSSRLTPVKVLSGVSGISAGGRHALALMANGDVYAWGRNEDGELGDGSKTLRTSPVKVANISGISQIAAGAWHSLALASNGTLYAWGNNASGRLGNGNETTQTKPIQVTGLNGLAISQIAAGERLSMALTSTGDVYSWGFDAVNNSKKPARIGGLPTIQQISAGDGWAFSLAVATNGAVWGWGWNDDGELGDGTTIDRSSPVQVHGLNNSGTLNGIVEVAAGGKHSLALSSSGDIYSWGVNRGYQLGDGTTNDRLAPVRVGIFTPVRAVRDVPTTALAGTNLPMTGTVIPANATNKEIDWFLLDAGTTGATLYYDNILRTKSPGQVVVEARIRYGLSETASYAQDFTINVVSPIVVNVPETQSSVMGKAISSITIPEATNNTSAAISYEVSDLPAGLVFNPITRVISGTPEIAVTCKVKVTAIGGGASASNAFTWEVTKASVAGGKVTITGKTKVGATLTAKPSGFTPKSSDISYAYQWYRGTKAIGAGKSGTYTLIGADAGQEISVKVTATVPGYNSASVSSAATTAIASGTINGGKVKIVGTRKVGYTLSAFPENFTPTPTKFTYQWLRDGVVIPGADAKGQYYKLTPADAGKEISVRVTTVLNGYAPKTLTPKPWKIK